VTCRHLRHVELRLRLVLEVGALCARQGEVDVACAR
jgi:hypothetical protein